MSRSSQPLHSRFDYMFRELFNAALGVFCIYVSAKVMKRVLDPNAETRERNRQRRAYILRRLSEFGVPVAALSGMSSAEEALLHDIVFPEDISSDFGSIGGLNAIKESVRELVVYPLAYPEVFRPGSSASGDQTAALLAPPKGVLLYGPPGTGKTMLAKALAKESGAVFLSLSPSSLMSKWLGETEATARAVFTLARRVQPAVVFIDEIDGLFRERSAQEHEAHKNLKAEFMQLWDGLTTDADANQVIVLGATNRPYDVDAAILRRMPRAFEVGLPNVSERAHILRTILKGVSVEQGFAYDDVAQVTEGYSGSDLKELCRAAMMQPAREAMRRTRQEGVRLDLHGKRMQTSIRPLTLADVLVARTEVARTEEQSSNYLRRSIRGGEGGSSTGVGLNEEEKAAAMAGLLRMLATPQTGAGV